jgi:acetoin:2,6-dichlorophenolindophenol oxidoreductase subunit beta
MGKTTAETIREITRGHLTEGNGLLLGQCVTAVGWIAGTVPDCAGIVELPTTDVAGAAFAVGCALAGRRPIFVVRYQGFMWLNSSSLVNYAAKSKEIWGVPAPVFIRSIGMEGGGTGHTASSCLHSIFMHSPGMPVAAPVTPGEYQAVWDWYMRHDDPVYVSEHRRTFTLDKEIEDVHREGSRITLFPISAARLNTIEAVLMLAERGIHCDVANVVWLKPFAPSGASLASLKRTGLGLVIDSDYEITGASRSIAYELMHATGASVHALGLEDRVCGAAARCENITPSAGIIADRVVSLLARAGAAKA